jgi:hypothetical protein
VATPTYTYKWYNGTTLLKTTTVPDLVLSSSYLGMHIRVKVTAAWPVASREHPDTVRRPRRS